MAEALFPEVICLCSSGQKALLAPVSKYAYVGAERGKEDKQVTLISPIGEFTFSLDSFLRYHRVSFPVCSLVFSTLGLEEPTTLLIPSLLELESALDWAPIVLGMCSSLILLYSLDKDPLEEAIKVASRLDNLILEYALKACYFKGIWYCKPREQIRSDVETFPSFDLIPSEHFYIAAAEPGYIVKTLSHGQFDKAFNFLHSRCSGFIKKNNLPDRGWMVGRYFLQPGGELEIVF